MYIHEAPTSNKADMRVVTAPAVHTIFSGKREIGEIVIPQTNTSFSYNFPTQVPNLPITGRKEKKVDPDTIKSQNATAPLSSITVSEDRNSFVNKDFMTTTATF